MAGSDGFCEFFDSANCCAVRPGCSFEDIAWSFAGALDAGAEIAGSAAPEFGEAEFAALGLAHAAGGAEAGKLSLALLSALIAPGLVARRSLSWSSKSDSMRPFDISSWYSERDGV